MISTENNKSDTSIITSYHFTLDGNGNREQIDRYEPLTTALSLGIIDYTYNVERNRLDLAGATAFGFDDEGQLSSMGGTTYTFDYEHRLTAISGQQSVFSYDGSGKRLKAVRNSVETQYVYDASGNLLAEADSNDVITKYFIHGMGLMAMVTPNDDEVYTYHFDAIGNTIAMTDSSEDTKNMYAYTPFGVIAGEVENVDQPFKYVGQHGVMAEDNGLYYMRSRYYDPEVGRFISEDPIGFAGGDVNVYAYVGNNPMLLNDPNGMIAPLVAFAIGKGLAVGISYAGVKISQWATNYMAVHNAVSNEVVSKTMGLVVGINAAEIGAMGAASGGMAAGRAAIGFGITNPQATQRAVNFALGASIEGTPPSNSPAGQAGALIRSGYKHITDNYISNPKNN